MTMPLLEPKAQRWRALAVRFDGVENLLVLGSSHVQVKEAYRSPWFDILDDDEHSKVRKIKLQKWVGAADRGHWQTEAYLPIPSSTKPEPLIS